MGQSLTFGECNADSPTSDTIVFSDAMETARIAIVYMLSAPFKPGDCPLLADALPRRSDQVRQGGWRGVGWWRDRTLLRCLNPNSWWMVRYLKTNSIHWHGEVAGLSQRLKGIVPFLSQFLVAEVLLGHAKSMFIRGYLGMKHIEFYPITALLYASTVRQLNYLVLPYPNNARRSLRPPASSLCYQVLSQRFSS